MHVSCHCVSCKLWADLFAPACSACLSSTGLRDQHSAYVTAGVAGCMLGFFLLATCWSLQLCSQLKLSPHIALSVRAYSCCRA